MKHLFICAMQFAAVQTGGASLPATPATPAPAPEPTSEKLTDIRAKIDAALNTDQSKFTRDQKLAINMQIFELGQDEKTEIANIKKAENEAKIQEARNAKIKMIDDLLAAHDANNAAIKSKMTIDEKNAVNDTFHKLRENVVNAVLGSKPTSAASGAATTGTRGETGKKIVARYLELKAEGVNITEAKKRIEAEGFARGTVGAEILKYQREIGEVA